MSRVSEQLFRAMMPRMDPGIRYITVLFIRQGERWLAQGLEVDLAAQGENVELAKRAFERTFMGQLELDRRMKREPLERLQKAPEQFWVMFRRVLQERRGPLATAPIESDVPSETPPAFMLVQAFPEASEIGGR